MIRADLDLIADPSADPHAAAPARTVRGARAKPNLPNPCTSEPFRLRRSRPGARASGRAGEDLLFAAGAGLALLDAHLRRDPPAAGALRARLALQSVADSAKILRLNVDEGALRDLHFAVGDAGQAGRLLQLRRELVGRPPNLDADRLAKTALRLDLALPDPSGLASSLKAWAGEGDPVSAAGKSAALVASVFPDAPTAEADILALWAFDLVLAIRLRWPRPVPLIATHILDPSLRQDGGGRRARPGDPAGPKAAAGAIALAAASALDLAADLYRRSEALIAVAPKLRSKPAAKIVDLLLAEDCVSPAKAARQARMTGRRRSPA